MYYCTATILISCCLSKPVQFKSLQIMHCLSFIVYRAIILSGGPGSVNDHNPVWCDPQIFELGIPIFGFCYGMQVCWLKVYS